MNFKKLIKYTIVCFVIFICFIVSVNAINEKPMKAAVMLYNGEDYLNIDIANSLKKISPQFKDDVELVFYDAKNDSNLQSSQLEEILNGDFQMIFLSSVDITRVDEYIARIKEKNLPVLLFINEPSNLTSLKSYGKSLFIGTDDKKGGELQGKIAIELINRGILKDRDNDGHIDYIMIRGKKGSTDDAQRTEYSIKTLKDNGIKTNNLISFYCDWNEECAKNRMYSVLREYVSEADLILASSDSMAQGAVYALHDIGYNYGDKLYIDIIGINGIQSTIDMIDKGYISGTVIQNNEGIAKALIEVGINLAKNKSALYNNEYNFDESGVAIRIPYKEIKIKK